METFVDQFMRFFCEKANGDMATEIPLSEFREKFRLGERAYEGATNLYNQGIITIRSGNVRRLANGGMIWARMHNIPLR